MRIRFSVALGLFVPAALLAQTTPDMQKILDRLQRLEDQNRELLTEIRSLRQELAATGIKPAEVPPVATPAQTAAPLDERVSVNEKRIDEQAQSKVESEHKLPVRLTGMLLFNSFLNGRDSGGQEYPVVAAATPGSASGGGTLRQTVLGLQFQGPEIFRGGKVNGSLYMDFFGGSGQSLSQLFRLRVATLDFAWKNTTFSIGQDKPIVSPREPTSLAQVGVSPLTGAGNLWLWSPQARVEQRFAFGADAGLRAQVGVYQTSESQPSLPSEYSGTLASSRPALEGRFEFWKQFGEDRRIEIAPAFHTSESHIDGFTVPSRLFSIDWLIRPFGKFDFTGQFFSGENTGVLGGLHQGLRVTPADGIAAVHSLGGWGQFTFRATSRLSFNIYGGEEDDRNSQLIFGEIGRNLTYAGNAMYRLGSNVIASFEAAQTRTTYIGQGLRLNPHYDLAIAYLY